eukprot:scaffold14133_cov54-Cylindrotheca_fusiformis.AAC.1
MAQVTNATIEKICTASIRPQQEDRAATLNEGEELLVVEQNKSGRAASPVTPLSEMRGWESHLW